MRREPDDTDTLLSPAGKSFSGPELGPESSSGQTETRLSGPAESISGTELRIPALTVVAHPDARRVGEVAMLPELPGGQAVRLSRHEPAFALPGSSSLAPLDDDHLSRQPILLRPGAQPREILVERAASRTPIEIDAAQLETERILTVKDLRRGVVLLLGRRIVLVFHFQHVTDAVGPSFGLIGASTRMIRLHDEIQVVADLPTPVLLRGESGTGKELIARALHDAGSRRDRPYVAVNMAAIPPALASSELFGAARGAYTGADRKRDGFFQRAHGGTLFLDEIGETPLDVQPLLLRALESGEIQPVGSVESQRVDLRVVAATDAKLERMIQDGRFREPLLHRLAGYEIRVPPLRRRRSDIGRLLYHFLGHELEAIGDSGALEEPGPDDRPWPPAELIAQLTLFDWPGNVRQLRNVARRLAIARRSGNATVGAAWLRALLDPQAGSGSFSTTVSGLGPSPLVTQSLPTLPASAGSPAPAPSPAEPRRRTAAEVSDEELRATLRAHRFELKPAATTLGISRALLYKIIEKNPSIRKAVELGSDEITAAVERAQGDLKAAAEDLEVSLQGLKRRMKDLGLR